MLKHFGKCFNIIKSFKAGYKASLKCAIVLRSTKIKMDLKVH